MGAQGMTVSELAYLKCPNKIRVAMINTTGHAPSLWVIKTKLRALERRPITQYGTNDGNEGVQYRLVAEGKDDPLLEALKREHSERFPPRPIERPRSEW
jgi:hypothetical protein